VNGRLIEEAASDTAEVPLPREFHGGATAMSHGPAILRDMKLNRMRSWRRLATQCAARRRATELPPPAVRKDTPFPLPPLKPPDDDREFLPHPRLDGVQVEPA